MLASIFLWITLNLSSILCQRSGTVVDCNNDGLYRCKNDDAKCVSDDAICDGVRDCFDASDEVAYGWDINHQCRPGHLTNYECPNLYFKCYTIQSTGCLSNDFLCDGNEDCQDHSDELNCPNVNFQLSSSTVLGVFIFALLIFTVTLCIAVLGVYATNKSRSRRRQAAQRQQERRSHLRSIFAISGSSVESHSDGGNGLDNPNFSGEVTSEPAFPPPYALVVEATLMEQCSSQNPQRNTVEQSGVKPPSYEDLFGGGNFSQHLDPSSGLSWNDIDSSNVEAVAYPCALSHSIGAHTSVPDETGRRTIDISHEFPTTAIDQSLPTTLSNDNDGGSCGQNDNIQALNHELTNCGGEDIQETNCEHDTMQTNSALQEPEN